MNKDKKIERLEQKLAKVLEENKKLKLDVRKAKREKSKASKKKRRQDRNADRRTATVTFDAIRRYTYSGFLIKTAFLLCMYAKCSPREAAKSLEVFNFMFEGLLGDSPCHTTIRTWLAKLGLDAIKNKHISIEEAYAIIMDASISVGDQQLLLALKVPADHTGKALTHSDEEVVGMAVSENWPAAKVKGFCTEIVKEQGHNPEYYITDNGKNIKAAIGDLGLPHHRDISHTLAVFLKQIYEKDEEFVNFKNLVANTKHLALTKFAYLMPPKQRSMARFMNMFPIVSWAKRMLQNYHRMTKDEKYYYSFVPRNASLVEELDEVLTAYTDIMRICKQEGFSRLTVDRCKMLLTQRMLDGNDRTRRLRRLIIDYLDKESELLTEEHPRHNISSDIIESDFGIFKDSMPANKTNGFTESILYIPLRSKVSVLADANKMDIKTIMERRTVKEVKSWKRESLRPNPMTKRMNLLIA